jgi:ubiquinone/menaquinone biosynthesis C-methylase UbiE
MLREASRNNAKRLQMGALHLALGSSAQSPFPDNSFDIVFCVNVIYFWENPEVDLKEIQRILKPGGIFAAGFRSKRSIADLPFVQYGFKLYEQSDWEAVLEKNQFRCVGAAVQVEPPIEFEGSKYTVESLCVLAIKPQ